MTTKRIVYTAPDGGVSVVIPAPEGRRDHEAEGAWLARIVANDIPSGATDVRIVEASAIPSDRTFREAWHNQAGKVGVRMDKAREIHRNRIRAARVPILASMDVRHLRAIEDKDDTKQKAVVAEKQALRDAPAHPDIDGAQTPEDLKVVWPLPADGRA